MRKHSMTAALAFAAIVAACGDTTGPKSVSLTGSWAYSASNLSGSGLSCGVSGTIVSITQTGSTFTGAYSGGTINCSGLGGTASEAIGSGTVVNGSVNGNAISFDFDTQDFHNVGQASGNSISGTATLKLDFGAPTGVVNLVGQFAAAKQ